MRVAHGIGVELAYTERGEGPVVLAIHDIAADSHSLELLLEALAPYARAIAYDRRGYGQSTAPISYEGTTVDEQGADAAALLRELRAGPALVYGDGLGALIALDLLKRHAALVSGAVLSNPPAFAFVPTATQALSAQREALGQALARGGPEAAVEAWLGPGADSDRLLRAQAAQRAFFADYAGLATLELSRAELRAIAVPTVLVTGPYTAAPVVAAADALAALIPGARRTSEGDVTTAVLSLLGAQGP